MYSVTNNRGFVPQSEQFEDREMKGEDVKAYKIIHSNDFAYNPARINVGSIAKYNGKEPCMISSLYVCFKANDGIDEEWLMHLLRTPKVQYYYQLNGEGGVRIYLFYPNFARIRTSIPNKEEQRKIANLLNKIDERIATQNKIIEDLKKLKSAIMATIFGKSNVTKSQWHEVKLGNICERVTRRNFNNVSKLILTIAAQHGLVSQTDFFNKSVASTDLSNYFLLNKGDFAYNKSYSGEYTWGAVKRLDLYPQGVLSPLYICFRPIESIVDSDFLLYLFESKCWYREVSEICVEGARNHGLLNVSVVDFFNIKLRIPELSEQKEIAEMMRTFSDKIEHSYRLYTLYNAQKTYLLSNMFI